jgi:hypothetical protein
MAMHYMNAFIKRTIQVYFSWTLLVGNAGDGETLILKWQFAGWLLERTSSSSGLN